MRALFQYGGQSLKSVARLVNVFFVCHFGPQKCEIHHFKTCIPILAEFRHITTIFLGRYDFNSLITIKILGRHRLETGTHMV